jgi:hypothetical protein
MDNTQFTYWQEALKCRAAKTRMPASHDGHPESGRYQWPCEGRSYYRAVMFWRHPDRGFVMSVDGKGVDERGNPYTEEHARKIWNWVSEYPVTKEQQEKALLLGEWWDGTTIAPKPQHGDNKSTDPFQRLKEELDDKTKSTETWLVQRDRIKTQEEADYAANLNRELLAYIKQADKLFEEEKAPHLEECRKVDAKYAFRKTVKQLADRTRDIVGDFLKAEKRRLDAEREKAWREQEAARIAREAVERQAREKQLRDDPIAAMTEPEPAPIAPIAPPPPVKVQAGGGVGSARGLRSVWTYCWPKEGAEEAYDKALLYHRRHPKIEEALEAILKAEVKSLKASCRTPGIEVYEDHVPA